MDTVTVTIDKIVHGGQGLGTDADGRKVFVWNALPGETVTVALSKRKKQYAEGIATEIITASPDRVTPKDDAFLSTSPWQIMTADAENKYKQQILRDALQQEHVAYDGDVAFVAHEQQWQYRNKMEYSFWGDDDGLHLALFKRGSHGKQIIDGSSIAHPAIDRAAHEILSVLISGGFRASQLKTLVLRCDQAGDVVAALYVKTHHFPRIATLGKSVKGIGVYYSNPKSPASVLTDTLYEIGDITLTDTILKTPITYDVHSFFQVHLPVFSLAATRMQTVLADDANITDLYAGVGTLALLTGASCMVEIDARNVTMAEHNAAGRDMTVILAPSEAATDYITTESALIVDPPRAGLHAKVTERILEVLPPKVVYLSCNPSTQARDLALLQEAYNITEVTGYNFFPRTPHVESLAVLVRKQASTT